MHLGIAASRFVVGLPRIVFKYVILITQLAVAVHVSGQSSPFSVDPSNRESVRRFYRSYLLPLIYDPEWTGNFETGDPGTISQAYRGALLLRVNAFRALAGVSSNVIENVEYSRKAQAAALMESVNFYSAGDLSHDPPPTWKYYTRDAAEGAGNSSLALNTHLGDPISSYIAEGIFSNSEVGHRLAVLNPYLRQIGIGTVPSRLPSGNSPQYDGCNALWINDASGPPLTRDGFLAWPSPGYFPIDLMSGWCFAALAELAGADFSQAQIDVSLNGKPVTASVTTSLRRKDLLVWNLVGVSIPDPTDGLDRVFDVTISKVKGSADVHYRVIAFDPAIGPGSTPPPKIQWKLVSPLPAGDLQLNKVVDAG